MALLKIALLHLIVSSWGYPRKKKRTSSSSLFPIESREKHLTQSADDIKEKNLCVYGSSVNGSGGSQEVKIARRKPFHKITTEALTELLCVYFKRNKNYFLPPHPQSSGESLKGFSGGIFWSFKSENLLEIPYMDLMCFYPCSILICSKPKTFLIFLTLSLVRTRPKLKGKQKTFFFILQLWSTKMA